MIALWWLYIVVIINTSVRGAYLVDIPGDITFAVHTGEFATFAVACTVFLQIKRISDMITLNFISVLSDVQMCQKF